ncbi:hypothetical protein LguiA_018470 [Lonicera macranthoides]
MAQRALSQCWVSPLPETPQSDIFNQGAHSTPFTSENISYNNFPLDIPSYKPINQMPYKSSPFAIPNGDLPNGFMFSPPDQSEPSKCTADVTSLLFNLSSPAFTGDGSKTSESVDFGDGPQQHFNTFSISSPQDAQSVHAIGFPFSLADEWKPSLPWDSPPCPSEISTTYSANKCYT